MHARERRQLRLFIRRDTYGRYLSGAGLPAARPLQHRRPRAVLRDPARTRARRRARSSSPPGSASRRPPTCTSWSTRPRASTIADVDTADLERRLAEASRSWRDDFVTAVIERVRRGGRRPPGPHVRRRRSPRPTRRTSRPRTASVDLGRLEAIARRAQGIDLSLYERDGRRPRRGPAQGVPDRPAAVAVRGAADAVVDGRRGRRRAALPAGRASAGRPSSTSSGCATARPCRPRPRELFQDALRAVWDGYNEIDGFNALVLGAGPDLAAGDGAARVREVHAAGRTRRSRRTTSRTRCASNVDITRLLVQLFEARFDPGATT